MSEENNYLIQALEERAETAEAERDRLRESLKWYANDAHYYNTGCETAMDDKGERARKALEGKP